jgi:aerobic carbon-monoxide dehydrogenase medium subunit
MIPAAFDYRRPGSIDEAIGLLSQFPDAKFLAGGHSLIPMMKLRLAQPSVLIDIARLPGLSGIHHAGDGRGRFTIGALTTHAEIAASDHLRHGAPALWDAANALGDPQVRNRGTIGGSCAHADPSGDYPAVMLALDAQFSIRGSKGKREVSAAEFFRGMFETALDTDEIITEISFGAARDSAYQKFAHPASHYALVGVAACLDAREGTIVGARVGITGVADAAFRAKGVEAALAGVSLTDAAALRAACASAASGADVRSEIEASAAYRRAMADVYCERAVEKAASRSR